MIGRLAQAADFQRLLATPPVRRTAHFLLHHLQAQPSRPARPARPGVSAAVVSLHDDSGKLAELAHVEPVRQASDQQLSTGDEPNLSQTVDNSSQQHWLGCVAPKRHARRAVTRNVLRRQMRAAAERHESSLLPGLWLVRLRQGFPVAQFPSADSPALRAAARAELDHLFRVVVR